MFSPHQVTKDFEKAVGEYTGAPYVVAVTSCTMALLLAVKWFIQAAQMHQYGQLDVGMAPEIEIPKRTYVSVPMSIAHAGGRPTFRNENWIGAYQLMPLPVWDAARRFTSGMYQELYRYEYEDSVKTIPQTMVCVSFHASKILGDTQGGAILTADEGAAEWLRKARFDGRTEGVAPINDTFDMLGYHCYMSPDVASRLLWKLSVLPEHNDDLKNDDYPDLSTMSIFQ